MLTCIVLPVSEVHIWVLHSETLQTDPLELTIADGWTVCVSGSFMPKASLADAFATSALSIFVPFLVYLHGQVMDQ